MRPLREEMMQPQRFLCVVGGGRLITFLTIIALQQVCPAFTRVSSNTIFEQSKMIIETFNLGRWYHTGDDSGSLYVQCCTSLEIPFIELPTSIWQGSVDKQNAPNETNAVHQSHSYYIRYPWSTS